MFIFQICVKLENITVLEVHHEYIMSVSMNNIVSVYFIDVAFLKTCFRAFERTVDLKLRFGNSEVGKKVFMFGKLYNSYNIVSLQNNK